MKRVLIIVVLLFITQLTSAQIKLASKPTTKRNIVDSLLAYTPKPYFLQFSTDRRKVTNLCSMQIPNTKILFENCEALKEIDLNDLKNRTKWVFFKMKMWQYFR